MTSLSGNGALDIRGGRFVVVPSTFSTSKMIPWDNPLFTVKLNGGQLEGTDKQNSVGVGVTLNANLFINNISSAGTPKIGGPNNQTIAGDGNLDWKGLLEKVGGGTITFNKSGVGTFNSDATTALKITNGVVVVTGEGVMGSGTFATTPIAVENNSRTDTHTGYGLQFTTNDTTSGKRYVKTITGTGSTLVGTGVILDPEYIRQGGTLRIDASGSVLMNANGADSQVNVVGALTLAGNSPALWTSKLDLNDNDLLIKSATPAAATAVTATTVDQVKQGRGTGDWTGTNGITSQAAKDSATNNGIEIVALSVVLNSDRPNVNFTGPSEFTTFDGQTVDSNTTIVKYTWQGDANQDGVVDGNDQNQLDFGVAFGMLGWVNGDFNYDGVVDGNDQNLLDFGAAFQSGTLSGGGPTSVPEPASLALLGLGGLLMLKRRNRKS